jgi:hypothetical protein
MRRRRCGVNSSGHYAAGRAEVSASACPLRRAAPCGRAPRVPSAATPGRRPSTTRRTDRRIPEPAACPPGFVDLAQALEAGCQAPRIGYRLPGGASIRRPSVGGEGRVREARSLVGYALVPRATVGAALGAAPLGESGNRVPRPAFHQGEPAPGPVPFPLSLANALRDLGLVRREDLSGPGVLSRHGIDQGDVRPGTVQRGQRAERMLLERRIHHRHSTRRIGAVDDRREREVRSRAQRAARESTALADLSPGPELPLGLGEPALGQRHARPAERGLGLRRRVPVLERQVAVGPIGALQVLHRVQRDSPAPGIHRHIGSGRHGGEGLFDVGVVPLRHLRQQELQHHVAGVGVAPDERRDE